MPAPSTGRDLHVDVPLSNVVVGRRPEGFIADQIMPVTNVGKQSDIYYKFNHLEWYRNVPEGTLRAPGTEAKHVHMTVTSDGYFAPNYALGTDWPVEDQVNADAVLQWARSGAEFVTDRLLMDYEMRVAGLAVTSANVSTTIVPSSGWNSAGRTALTDMISWKETFRQITGMLPNLAIIPEPVMQKLTLNDQLRDILYGDRGGVVTPQQVAGLLGISKVLVPTVQVNTAVEADPQGGTFSDVWAGNGNFWMMRVQTMAGMFTDTWANAFRWTNPLFGVPWAVERHPYDTRKKRFDLEVHYYQDEKIVSSDLALRVSSLTAT